MTYVKPVFRRNNITEEKEKFKHSKCLLTISVGQEVHEGEKFSTTIELINSSFQSCIMLIDDSLQRHTMALEREEDADFFYDHSIQEGNLWLERNEKYYKNLTILDKIIRWDMWLFHAAYHEQKNKIITLMQNDPDYKYAFDETIEEFLRRYYKRAMHKTIFDIERDRKLCRDYLVEECTALCLWIELNCHFEVYPNKRNLAMDETHKRFVQPSFPHLLNGVAIKFKNRKQFKPQRLNYTQENCQSIEYIME